MIHFNQYNISQNISTWKQYAKSLLRQVFSVWHQNNVFYIHSNFLLNFEISCTQYKLLPLYIVKVFLPVHSFTVTLTFLLFLLSLLLQSCPIPTHPCLFALEQFTCFLGAQYLLLSKPFPGPCLCVVLLSRLQTHVLPSGHILQLSLLIHQCGYFISLLLPISQRTP